MQTIPIKPNFLDYTRAAEQLEQEGLYYLRQADPGTTFDLELANLAKLFGLASLCRLQANGNLPWWIVLEVTNDGQITFGSIVEPLKNN